MIALQRLPDRTTLPPMIGEGFESDIEVLELIERESGHPKRPSRRRVVASVYSLCHASDRMKCGTDLRVFCNSVRAIRLDFLKDRTARNSVGKSFSRGLDFHRPAGSLMCRHGLSPRSRTCGPYCREDRHPSSLTLVRCRRHLGSTPLRREARESRTRPSTFMD